MLDSVLFLVASKRKPQKTYLTKSVGVAKKRSASPQHLVGRLAYLTHSPPWHRLVLSMVQIHEHLSRDMGDTR